MKYIDGLPVPEVGDKVLVRHDLINGERYYHRNVPGVRNIVIGEMYRLRGQYLTIGRVCSDGQYEMNEVDCKLGWTMDMLDLSEYESTPINISKDDLMEFIRG